MNMVIRILIYQKSYMVEYIVSDRLKFLFPIPYSFHCAQPSLKSNVNWCSKSRRYIFDVSGAKS